MKQENTQLRDGIRDLAEKMINLGKEVHARMGGIEHKADGLGSQTVCFNLADQTPAADKTTDSVYHSVEPKKNFLSIELESAEGKKYVMTWKEKK